MGFYLNKEAVSVFLNLVLFHICVKKFKYGYEQ